MGTTSRALWLLTGALVVAAGALSLVVAASSTLTAPGAGRIWWPLLALAFLAADVAVARVEHRGEVHTLGLVEAALVVGLAFCSPPELLAARLLAVTAVLVHARLSAVKLTFNVAMTALETAVAVVAYAAIAHGAAAVEPRGWLAAYAASLAAYLVSLVCVTAVISLSLRRVVIAAWPIGFGLVALVIATALGLLTSFVVATDWRALWLVLGIVGVALAGNRVIVRLRHRHADLQLLYRFTEALAGATETDEVTRRTLGLARELLRVDVAELVLVVPDGVIVKRLDAQGHIVSDVRTGAADRGPYAALVATRAPVRLERGRAHAIWRDALAAPMTVDGELAGVLVAADRAVNLSAFDDDDLRLLGTFAEHAAMALRSGELVTQLRADAIEKEFQALHDPLTGLANRTMLTQRVERALGDDPSSSQLAVFFCDLDGFKEVNDSLGHPTGDQLLVEIAERMARTFSGRGLVGRFGGDEFVLVIDRLESVDQTLDVAAHLRSVIQEPVVIDQLTLQVGVSIGIALAPRHGSDALTLFQHADVAMYLAKDRRSNVELYDPELDQSSPRRVQLAAELRTAIDEGQLSLHYQPQVDLRTGRIVGLEGLARWAHPRHGSVPPDEFIPVAERSGLIHPLTQWVLRTALADLARWRSHYPQLGVSVNLSVRSLLDASLVDSIAGLLRTSGVAPEALTLELVESSLMSDAERSLQVLSQLDDMGIGIAIDDFGTGYSSLSYLKRLPVHEVKIDKSFVMQMANDPDDTIIVRSTIDLARNLGLRVVAEGVENVETRRLLERLGCDRIQGYLIGRPLPAARIDETLGITERAGVAGALGEWVMAGGR